MILQALNDYYRRKCDDADPAQRLPAFGLEQKEIPFVLEITTEGELVQLLDTRTLNEKKKKVAQTFRVPQGVKKTSGVAANLLWDTLEYVLGVDTKGKPERVAEQHAHFVARIEALPQSARDDASIQAILKFFGSFNLTQLEAQPTWAQALESNAVMSFRLHRDIDLVCQRPAVVKAVLNVATDPNERLSMCLVTGDDAPIQRLHASIKGVWGAQSSGANIVSFNARAFESYGKTERQGENAPVSQAAAFAYTTALNHLLRKNSNQRIQVGDASTVFWADRDSEFESVAADIFGDPPKDDPDKGARALHALLSAIQSGQHGGQDDKNRFHVLGLAPNAARISIRFYHCLPLAELGKRISQHFKDLEMARGLYDPQYPSLKRLLQAVCLSTNSQPFGDIDRLPPNLGGAIVDAVFTGPDVPYPSAWLNAAVGRCRAEQAKKTQQGKQAPNVPYARAAVVKACLNRQIRRSSVTPTNQPPEKEFLPMLDLTNTNPAYRLGRLFSVLERIQEASAGGPGKLNSTIRDRYYGAASSTPVAVFTTLLRLKNAHLKKLTVGQAAWFEKLLGEILDSVTDFPKHFPLPDQGRFALGYYHQRQDFFAKKPDDSTPITEGNPS
ncbi:MAG: type I-C CRISPR-associated protein Cas8c/Csd1 [Rhodoferax sp.]|uniref:type I-C CRISPR-associated protein Cas8c/Csd1 n=1 Tax=Rhodoferax sp. TaxID=50421 RepID=UPI0017DA0339|nr:type I-C CRISPR-associated protein Cas8c/Csd1 [Rhodoferax sp.]NMM12162.1 type I-C CRISPR-associated protein Cas8c/Csd1 [Rhodoferax sp.]NMM20121.1 type I-C CRISPR-associated protein Cas8c/Csd1 [Rhodoferax sp.]